MLQEMSSSFSHELITPIKCIISMAQAQRDKTIDRDEIKVLELIMNTGELILN